MRRLWNNRARITTEYPIGEYVREVAEVIRRVEDKEEMSVEGKRQEFACTVILACIELIRDACFKQGEATYDE